MPHNTIDNRQEKLVDHVRCMLPTSRSARFAADHSFLSSLEAMADQLTNVQELRLLIGNTSSQRTIEQIAEGYRRLEQVRHATEDVGHAAAFTDQTDRAEREHTLSLTSTVWTPPDQAGRPTQTRTTVCRGSCAARR
ncbi:MAG: hypothetical protein PVH62_08545 [Anaerolineae bacterium]|jgi:hypothetical protein